MSRDYVHRSESMMVRTGDGLDQFVRRWRVTPPRAAALVVHGIGEHSGRYEHVGSFLASRGVDTWALDQRGFGRSEGRRAHVEAFDRYLDDVAARLGECRGLGVPVVLLGHSLGGLVATEYLLSARPKPDLAVLSAPALAADIPRWQRIAAPLLGRVLPTLFVPSKIDGELLSRDAAVGDRYAADPLAVAGATAGLGREILRAMERATAAASDLATPTYVIHGGADELVPVEASTPLLASPAATRRIWPGLRHECFNEPEHLEVLTEMGAWLDDRLAESA